MEETVVEFLSCTVESLAERWPAATWRGVVVGVSRSSCGVAAVGTRWRPATSQTTGVYAAVYRWVHALAGHFAQNKGALADAKSAEVQSAVQQVTGK